MTTTNIERLEQQIESLVREHIAEVRRNAVAAMERAFASSKPTKLTAARSRAQRVAPPRSVAELKDLAERLYSVVCANPGTGMAKLSPLVGATSLELSRPAEYLKKAGRVRIVGQRSAARYFPMGKKSAG